MACSMNDLRANVIKGIADMLFNMPQNPITDQGKFGEVDLQTRFYNPLFASIFADVTKYDLTPSCPLSSNSSLIRPWTMVK
ncbi:hypothetical protein DFQ29_008582 [Apophysomyces sp. BC1021]|nr:hypothetical protein DFQ29_008582 [Apophysomyces sp. BC1021]